MKIDFTVETLGKRTVKSPITLSSQKDDYIANYRNDNECIYYEIEITGPTGNHEIKTEHIIERAGPREYIYFEPAKTNAAIVTCGGLCPGLNDVIRSIVMTLWYRYGVKRIHGIRYGYRGLISKFNIPDIMLTPDIVADIHMDGGTILGSSRGYGNHVEEIVDTLERMNINIFFAIGGDGTQKGAMGIAEEIKKRGLKIAVVGIPKTIDNDLSFVQKSFGFETAVSKAVEAVTSAHVEAKGAINGIGLVKVMGRESGFIAAHTALASSDVNFVLIPEVPFDLDGDNGLLKHLEERLKNRGHAVILVAEGAGENFLPVIGTDASGNKKFADVGIYLKE